MIHSADAIATGDVGFCIEPIWDLAGKVNSPERVIEVATVEVMRT